jgi:hypothetical protein
MVANRKKQKRRYSPEELYNPQIDLSREACLYGRQSSKDQVIQNIQSHISQTVMLLEYTKSLGFRDDRKTGKVTLFVENQVVDADGNVSIKNASGTWPIDRRPGLKAICDLIESGKVGVVVAEFVDRLFRDEDRIDSNIFIKTCREHDCFVHISSKRMTYNFANDQHAEMFRLEVQMAAMYIKNHVKGTMLRRRDMVVRLGQWGGIGAIPVGYITCSDETSPLCGKFIPYEPHAKVVLWIFVRFIELGYDFGALCREVADMPFVFPPFEPGVPIIRFMMTPTKEGYLISEDTLRHLLTNEVYIGNFRRQIQDGEVYIRKNHPAIVPEDVFWSVYDHLKDIRPDGIPTGRHKLVRYSQARSIEERKPLLKPISDDGSVYWEVPYEKKGGYKIIKRRQLGLGTDHVLFLDADVLETAIVKRLLERLHTIDLNNLNKQRNERKEEIGRKLKKIAREIESINEELETLKTNMGKIKTESVVLELEAQIVRILERRETATANQKRLEEALKHDALGTLEEELGNLEELWPLKPFPERKALLGLLIKTLTLKFLSPHFYSVEIAWNYDNWGIDKAIFMRHISGSKDWSKEELTSIAALYPQTPQLDILKAMPNRTWSTIQQRAFLIGVRRTVKLKEKVDSGLTWSDIAFLEKHHLTMGDFRKYKHNFTDINQTAWLAENPYRG